MTRHGAHPEGLILTKSNGEQRGFVDPKRCGVGPVLEDLWVMQGSICDLKCKHCYTASSPRNQHLEQILFAELRPHLEDAVKFGVQRVCFTGGEVFVNEDVLKGRARCNEEFLASLEFALEIAPVEILTNGRRYIRNHFDALQKLRARHGDRLRLRITLESPEPARHDAIRGRSTFAQTAETVRELAAMGFIPVITAERPLLGFDTDESIRSAYLALFDGIPVEINLIENMLEAGRELERIAVQGATPHPEVFITTNCFSILSKPPESLMCHFSRCIQKIEGALRFYPCPVIYNDPRFELGGSISESLRRVYVAHKNCYDYCTKGRGATCRTRTV